MDTYHELVQSNRQTPRRFQRRLSVVSNMRTDAYEKYFRLKPYLEAEHFLDRRAGLAVYGKDLDLEPSLHLVNLTKDLAP